MMAETVEQVATVAMTVIIHSAMILLVLIGTLVLLVCSFDINTKMFLQTNIVTVLQENNTASIK